MLCMGEKLILLASKRQSGNEESLRNEEGCKQLYLGTYETRHVVKIVVARDLKYRIVNTIRIEILNLKY